MICVDSSVWIAALRDETGSTAVHLAELVDADVVIVPAPVRIEVLAGSPRQQLAALADGFSGVAGAIPGSSTWEKVEGWVGEAVAAGQRFAVVDLLIAATAREHDASLWSLEVDFKRMQELGFVALYTAP
ncbi:MAG TPA: PIN domain-containing protein [Gemmatimonadales bacterium]